MEGEGAVSFPGNAKGLLENMNVIHAYTCSKWAYIMCHKCEGCKIKLSSQEIPALRLLL